MTPEIILHLWDVGTLKAPWPQRIVDAMPMLAERGFARFHDAPLLDGQAPHWRFTYKAHEAICAKQGRAIETPAPRGPCACEHCVAYAQIDLEDYIKSPESR